MKHCNRTLASNENLLKNSMSSIVFTVALTASKLLSIGRERLLVPTANTSLLALPMDLFLFGP